MRHIEIFSLFATMGLKDDGFQRGMQTSQSEFAGLESKAKKTSTGVKVAVAAIAASAGVLVSSIIKIGSEFNAQMSTVQAISGATGKELDKLTAKAEEMGATTQFTAKEAGEALEYMAMAGWDTTQMVGGLEGVMYAAGASGENLARVSDIVTDGLTAFGMEAEQSGHFADVLAQASANSNTNIGMMGETFKHVGPIAGSLGYNIEDVALATGLMADNGIKGSQAGTSLRAILTGLIAPTDKASAAMAEMGVEVTDSSGAMLPLEDLLVSLREGFADLTPEVQAQTAEMIAGTRGMTGLLSIVNTADTDFDNLTRAIENSTGAAKRMNETRLDNLQGDITILKSGLEGLGIQIYRNFDLPMRDAAQAGSSAVNQLARELARPEMVNALENIGHGFASIVGAAGQVTAIVIPAVVRGFGLVVNVLDVLTPALAAGAAGFAAYQAVAKVSGIMKNVAASYQLAQVQLALYMKEQKLSIIATGAEAAALTAKELAVGVLTGKVTLAAAAQTLWNKAQLANPIALKVAAVAALAAGLVTLVRWLGRATEEEEKHQRAIEGTVVAGDDLKRSMEDSASAYQANTDALEESGVVALRLTDRIYELAAAEDKSAEDKRKLAVYVDMLNESMEGLNLAYNEEQDTLSQTREQIEGLIDARQEELKAAAARERAIEVAKEQFDIEEQLYDISRKKAEAERIHGEGTRAYTKAVKDLVEQEEELSAELDTTKTSFENLTDRVVENETRSVEAAGNVSESWVAANGEILQSQEEVDDRNKELLGLIDDYVSAVTNMFTTINTEAKASREEQLKTLDENYEASQNFVENLDLLVKRGLDEAIVNSWRDAGLESAAEVEQWANATDDEIKALNEKMARNMDEGLEHAHKSLQRTGEDAMEGLKAGVESKMPDVKTSGKEAAEALSDGADTALEIKSPSRVFMRKGEFTMEGLALGIKNRADKVLSVVSDVTKGIKETLEDIAPKKTNLDLWTRALIDDATKGLTVLESTVIQKTGQLPDSMYQAMFPAVGRVSDLYKQLTNASTVGTEQFIAGTVQLFATLPEKIWQAIIPAQNLLGEWHRIVVNSGQETGREFVQAVITELNKLPQEMKKPLDAAHAVVKKWTADLQKTAKSEIPKFVKTGIDEMQKFPDAMPAIGRNIVEGLWRGMQSRQSWFKRNVSGFIRDATRQMRRDLDIRSPSGVTAEMGGQVAEGFIVGLAEWSKRVKLAVSETFDVSNILDSDFMDATGSTQAQRAPDGSGGLTIHQHIETTPQTPYETQQASIAAWRRVLWEG